MFLDGRMDEPFWDNVTPITNFTQQQPVEGAPPSERTEIYVAYDDENLYIGAFFYDSNPDEILSYQKRYDESLDTDDRFMWMIDTFNDGRSEEHTSELQSRVHHVCRILLEKKK